MKGRSTGTELGKFVGSSVEGAAELDPSLAGEGDGAVLRFTLFGGYVRGGKVGLKLAIAGLIVSSYGRFTTPSQIGSTTLSSLS